MYYSHDFRWRRSCTASGPQLHGSLGSTGRRPTLPHYSLDPVHGPDAGLRLRPQLLPPACPRRACSVGLGLFRSVALLPRLSWPRLVPSFSLCDFRLFVNKRIVSPYYSPYTPNMNFGIRYSLS